MLGATCGNLAPTLAVHCRVVPRRPAFVRDGSSSGLPRHKDVDDVAVCFVRSQQLESIDEFQV